MNPLLNKDFIEKLDKVNERELYAKIISLNSAELPVEEITGKVSQGSLNIDGTSAVRRTCSLTLIADRVNINEFYWSFTTKFKLFIGMKIPDVIKKEYTTPLAITADTVTGEVKLSGGSVYIYADYPDIIWFPQGIFAITDFKVTMNTNGTDNVYITGKDKMAFLNGDLGGVFPHATDVGTIEERTYDDEHNLTDVTKTPLSIKSIITEMVHKYGNEPFHNIVVNDLDDNALILLDYNGDNDLYLFKNVSTGLFENVVFDGDVIRYDRYNNEVILSKMTDTELDDLSSTLIKRTAKKVKNTDSYLDNTYYTVIKCTRGAVVGYRTTDWTFPSEGGELIADVGETVVKILDKICKAFDDTYEYFYDVYGKFIFQKKLTYVNTSWNNLVNTWELNEKNELENSTYAESSKLVSQVEYSFIGGLLMTTFNNTPNLNNIRNDFAIWGKKKSALESTENSIHMRVAIDEKPESYTSFEGRTYTSTNWDWRELIYQMAVDYYNHNHDDDYEVVLSRNNKIYSSGKTGYEPYYEDMLEFWRYLYNPESKDNAQYFIEKDSGQEPSDFNALRYWNRTVIKDPAALIFWFDFLDGKTSNLSKYSVKAIGDRAKAINNDKVRAIYYGEIPNLIYISPEHYTELKRANMLKDGYTYIMLPEGMEDFFDSTRKNKSAQDELDQLIYQHAYCNESITINSLPIYHLEPNMRISVFDDKAKINGEYIVNKIVIPLNYNGTMQVMATRAPIRLF